MWSVEGKARGGPAGEVKRASRGDVDPDADSCGSLREGGPWVG